MTNATRALALALVSAASVLACSKPSATATATATVTETHEAATAAAYAPPAATTNTAQTTTAETATAETATPEPEPIAGDAGARSREPVARTAPPASGKPVKVVHIGMHIGGGPNDDVTKEPIRASVRPRFPELAACYAATGAKVESDFGVDLLIPAAGGKAKVSHPRTTLKGAPAELTTCVVGVFEATEFLKPLNGLTGVSYSMRFTP